ncbi:hypothetical protein KVR01_000657 [Diaporthe batatas]|uniref:uncharacterized protein n=1 Tax=Diaporthe batatas TaxID=748121 RepID=UPI001D047AD5|nr:uncharacterized protein KVR01_000657 [Diaporthe batatas]KAG8169912.1 hypothetical protein KVR01_000657 [Diaporthe batatas]
MSFLTPTSDGIPRAVLETHDQQKKFIVDDAVMKHFPPASKLKNARSHGASFWTRSARIDIELADGSTQTFFLKVAKGDLGKSMLRGEFEGATTIYKYTPEGIPRPVAWGTYKADSNVHFYMSEFVDMVEDLPDIHRFSSMLAKLHHDSMADPDAPKEFGYHVMTHEGSMYQDISWSATWEELYRKRFQSFVDQEAKSQGPSDEIDGIVPLFIAKVIPRLLRPLRTHGRINRPVALHGDIWYGNIATNAATGEPIYFDPAVFWGHNECQLGPHWMREYHKFFPISDPVEDYEDRNALYAVAIADMKHLLERYPNGYQGE